jgi:hypothetical protein
VIGRHERWPADRDSMKLKAAGTWPRALRRMGELRSPEAGLETRRRRGRPAWTPAPPPRKPIWKLLKKRD